MATIMTPERYSLELAPSPPGSPKRLWGGNYARGSMENVVSTVLKLKHLSLKQDRAKSGCGNRQLDRNRKFQSH
jgi:hypothetical protein